MVFGSEIVHLGPELGDASDRHDGFQGRDSFESKVRPWLWLHLASDGVGEHPKHTN